MSKSLIQDYQKELKKKNLYLGPIDGDFGILTTVAAQQYHCPNGTVPAWMSWAAQELGVSEIYGARANPRIVHYHSYTGLGADSDEVAWCASFVNAGLIEGANIKGTKSAAAGSFKTYGVSCSPDKFGAILLIPTLTGSKRHVFFCNGSWKGYIFGLGGNQSNAVNVKVYAADKITESRFPIL